MEKQGIQFFLIAIDQGIQFTGAGKYDVVVINIQYMLILGVDPKLIGQCLAHRAGSVTAGVVMELDMAAFITYGDIHSICPGLAVQDMVYGLCLVCGRRVRLQIFGVELPEDILHGRVFIDHGSHPPCF